MGRLLPTARLDLQKEITRTVRMRDGEKSNATSAQGPVNIEEVHISEEGWETNGGSLGVPTCLFRKSETSLYIHGPDYRSALLADVVEPVLYAV